MNMFLLDIVVLKSVRAYYKAHVGKIALEALQMLYTAIAKHCGIDEECKTWRKNAPIADKSGKNGYKPTHWNHPMVLWVQKCEANFLLCLEYVRKLCEEFRRRKSTKKRVAKPHACAEHIPFIESANPWAPENKSLATRDFLEFRDATTVEKMATYTVPPICVGKDFQPIVDAKLQGRQPNMDEVVEIYRMYYATEKGHLCDYNNCERPDWLPNIDVAAAKQKYAAAKAALAAEKAARAAKRVARTASMKPKKTIVKNN